MFGNRQFIARLLAVKNSIFRCTSFGYHLCLAMAMLILVGDSLQENTYFAY
jgi:hypothetical protein